MTPKSAGKGWRFLRDGEIIQVGDQIKKSHNGRWGKPSASLGCAWKTGLWNVTRRKLAKTAKKPSATLTPKTEQKPLPANLGGARDPLAEVLIEISRKLDQIMIALRDSRSA